MVLKAKEGVCDDCLSEVTGISPRQAINTSCRSLSARKIVARVTGDCAGCGRVKIINSLRSTVAITAKKNASPAHRPQSALSDRPWYWEGNVQHKIAQFLISHGIAVVSEADTASRQAGKDIVGKCQDGQVLWVTVKGFPEKSKNTQARHWFAGALHDLARYRDENRTALLAMGLPRGFTTYENLIRRNTSVRTFLGYRVYWVQADGTVTVEEAT